MEIMMMVMMIIMNLLRMQSSLDRFELSSQSSHPILTFVQLLALYLLPVPQCCVFYSKALHFT